MRPPERLDVYCWCERRVLRVVSQMILDGLTGSCGHPECCPAIAWPNPPRETE